VPHSESRQSLSTRHELTRTTQVAATLHEYVRVRCAHKLGLPAVAPSEVKLKYFQPAVKGSKVFKIMLRETTTSGTAKQVTVRVPAKIRTMDFYTWVYANIPTAIGIVTPNGRSYNWGSRDVPESSESV